MMKMKKMALAFCGMLAAGGLSAQEAPKTIEWNANSFVQVQRVEGIPQIVQTRLGMAAYFDGASGVFLGTNPLEGLERLTMEVIFKPDGDGEFAQRYMHFGEVSGERIMFETRVNRDRTWYSDAYIRLSDGNDLVLIDSTLTHPTDRWYNMALVIDGQKATSYVNGVEQGSGAIAYIPINKGISSVGVRQNLVNFFKGTLLRMRITPAVLTPDQFLKDYEELNK